MREKGECSELVQGVQYSRGSRDAVSDGSRAADKNLDDNLGSVSGSSLQWASWANLMLFKKRT